MHKLLTVQMRNSRTESSVLSLMSAALKWLSVTSRKDASYCISPESQVAGVKHS